LAQFCAQTMVRATSFLTPEMAHDVIETPSFFWSTRILDLLCAVLIFLLTANHAFVIYTHQQRLPGYAREQSSGEISRSRTSISLQQNKEKQAAHRWAKISNALTLCFMTCSWATIMMLLLNIWSAFPVTYSCDIIVYVLCTVFHLTKSIFYAMLITRLQLAFGTSAYGYSKCEITALFSFVIAYGVLILVGTPFVIYGKWIVDDDKGFNWCHVHINENGGVWIPIGVLLWIILDVIISTLLLYMFLKPLRSLLRTIDTGSAKSKRTNKLGNLTVKYSILTWISIVVSMLSLLLYLWKHITTLIELNLLLSCVCVVLMHTSYENTFRNVCKLCTQCCHCICKSKYHDTEAQRMETTVRQSSHIQRDSGTTNPLQNEIENENKPSP